MNVTQIATIDRDDIAGKIGQLTGRRLLEVWEGISLVLRPAALDISPR